MGERKKEGGLHARGRRQLEEAPEFAHPPSLASDIRSGVRFGLLCGGIAGLMVLSLFGWTSTRAATLTWSFRRFLEPHCWIVSLAIFTVVGAVAGVFAAFHSFRKSLGNDGK
jgi:hypothetical protein